MRNLRAIHVVVLLLLAACGTEASPSAEGSVASAAASREPSPSEMAEASASPEAGLPAGWTRVTLEEAGFSIAMPEGWITASAEGLGDGSIFDELAEDNPEAAAALEQARQAIESGQMQFFAFDTGQRTIETGFATNINIINVGDPGATSAQEVADQMAIALPQQIPVDGEVQTDTTTLPAGDAAVVDLEWTLTQGSESVPLSVTQYAILTAEDGYILSMTTPRQFAAELRDTWASMAESFRLE